MWETITQAEIEEAKACLSRKREEALSRQAAELKSVDAQLDDIQSFERVVAAFFEEYMDPAAPCAPVASVPEEAATLSFPAQSTLSLQALDKAPSIVLQIRQNILPRFNNLRPDRRSIGASSQISMALPER